MPVRVCASVCETRASSAGLGSTLSREGETRGRPPNKFYRTCSKTDGLVNLEVYNRGVVLWRRAQGHWGGGPRIGCCTNRSRISSAFRLSSLSPPPFHRSFQPSTLSNLRLFATGHDIFSLSLLFASRVRALRKRRKLG